jgi:hypothetical protein
MVGDTYIKFSAAVVPIGSYMEVLPTAGVELIIHNVYHSDNIELMMVDGAAPTHLLAFMEDAGKSVVTNMYFHVTEDQYLRIYNRGSTTQYLAVDGVISAE